MVFIKKKSFARKRAWSYSFQKLQYWQFLTKNSSQCDMYLLKRALRENTSCNKTEVSTHQFVPEKWRDILFAEPFWAILSHFEPFLGVGNILTIFGRSAVGARRSRGRSAGRSATPDCQPERNPERNSENWAGARLERNSDFCRSANTLQNGH